MKKATNTVKVILIFSAVLAFSFCQAFAGSAEKKEPVLLNFDNKALLSGHTWDDTLAAGEWDAELGMQFRGEDPDEGDDGDAGWGYLEISWESGPLHGLQLGLGGLLVTPLWESDAFEDEVFDDDGVFQQQERWTEVYLKYTLPGSKSFLLLGRADEGLFGEPAAGDGDFYEGFGITIKGIPRVTIKAHAVKEWINNASPSWDFDGMDSQWAEMEEASLEVGEDTPFGAGDADEFGDLAYTFMTEIEAVKDVLTLSPYVQYHEDVAACFGTGFEFEHSVNDLMAVGLEGAYVWHQEDTPDEYWPDDEDFDQKLVHAYVKIKGFRFGAGYFGISDDIPLFNGPPGSGQFEEDFKDVFLMDEMDPMEEDLGKYGEQGGGDTYYFDAGYSRGPFSIDVLYGEVDNAIAEDENGNACDDGEARELNIILGLQITEKLEAEFIYADVEDEYSGDDGADGEDDRSHAMYGGALVWKF